jgi:DGQHR domain-containing protein
MSENTEMVTVVAMECRNLDTVCYRGTAPLANLSLVSKADQFDQVTNPNGLQRDLNKKHAVDVYEYVTRDENRKLPRALPEVVLNVRDKSVASIEPLVEQDGVKLVRITFDMAAIDKARSAKVSRIDGNHRLMFGNGDGADREPVGKPVPFQLHYGLSKDQEASLFVDMNANHKSLNTSHLHVLRSRLTAEEQELVAHPERVFARRLASDEGSPFAGKVYLGGSKQGSNAKGIKYPVTFTALEGAIRRMLRGSMALKSLTSTDAQYAAIRNYWQAVAEAFGERFASDETLLMKSIGISTLAQLAPSVLDRLYTTGELDSLSMTDLLKYTVDVMDWDRKAEGGNAVSGMSGNRAVLIIAGQMADKLPAFKQPAKAS